MTLCTFYSAKTLENEKHQKSQYLLTEKSLVIRQTEVARKKLI